MAHLKEHWFPYLLGVVILFVILNGLSSHNYTSKEILAPVKQTSIVPNIYDLSNSDADNLIRYGKDIIDNTAKYFGPHGLVASITNGMNCQNCHRESGTKLFTNNFLSVASTYPKFRERSGRLESVEYRVNECMQRSLNGESIDSLSKEMRAMVAYIKWTGKNVKKNVKVEGVENKELSFLNRVANPVAGAKTYISKCSSCHGANGEGLTISGSYVNPPLWGEHSYAVSAGMYRITKLASFIRNNMPNGATFDNPQLKDEEAWDVAAYINSQPHPIKMFASDWHVLKTKPVDYPFGPYIDAFSEKQHKYGPFDSIKKVRDIAIKKK
ncbi:MAG TPA: c-type cytochrome [Chitinophagaceae bacterium]